MFGSVRSIAKGFGAARELAGIGLFAGVRSHVSLQQPGPGESLAAHITLVTEIVGENVHEESW